MECRPRRRKSAVREFIGQPAVRQAAIDAAIFITLAKYAPKFANKGARRAFGRRVLRVVMPRRGAQLEGARRFRRGIIQAVRAGRMAERRANRQRLNMARLPDNWRLSSDIDRPMTFVPRGRGWKSTDQPKNRGVTPEQMEVWKKVHVPSGRPGDPFSPDGPKPLSSGLTDKQFNDLFSKPKKKWRRPKVYVPKLVSRKS